jgi:NAD(P)-dependent dehydrogenase (short-subunit alcohol dehydrogenase family)
MPDQKQGQIVVTGASRGIGASIALALKARGYTVAGTSRNGDTAVGPGYACEVTDEAAIVRTIAAIAAKGPIIGLVNNAGIYETGPSAKLTAQVFEHTMRTNTTSVVSASREVYPHLKANGGGLIVNLGSFFDKLGVAEHTAYCASKAAIAAITRCHAVEWAADGIRVMNVAPGYIETEFNRAFLSKDKVRAWLQKRIPARRPGTPEEVAKLVASLFGDDIGFLTGETIYIDGGQGMNH